MLVNKSTITESITRVRSGGIIAIIRGRFTSPQVLTIADALATAGVTAMEVTLNSPDALTHITALQDQFGSRLLIGAGTVRNVEHVSAAIAAGAMFLISPGFDPASVAAAVKADVLHLPGVYTATEAQQAASAGARMLKLFPCDTLSPTYLKALRAPLDDVDFVPTGGVSLRTSAPGATPALRRLQWERRWFPERINRPMT